LQSIQRQIAASWLRRERRRSAKNRTHGGSEADEISWTTRAPRQLLLYLGRGVHGLVSNGFFNAMIKQSVADGFLPAERRAVHLARNGRPARPRSVMDIITAQDQGRNEGSVLFFFFFFFLFPTASPTGPDPARKGNPGSPNSGSAGKSRRPGTVFRGHQDHPKTQFCCWRSMSNSGQGHAVSGGKTPGDEIRKRIEAVWEPFA